MAEIIKAKAWQDKNTVRQAKALLGKFLVRRRPDGRVDARMITEVEAYDGERDLASHARAGRTARTEIMYAAGGHWYVYLCYGIHEMLNLVVGPEGWPAAVLIRGVEGFNGPGKLTKGMGLDRALNGRSAEEVSGLWIEDRGVKVPRNRVSATPRVGIDFAGPVWAAKPWRFIFEPPGSKSARPAPRKLKGP